MQVIFTGGADADAFASLATWQSWVQNQDLERALPRTALAFAPITNRQHLLFPEESALVESSSDARKAAFSSGRFCAHEAMRVLGHTRSPVPRVERRPVWPPAMTGSITHSKTCAGAIVNADAIQVGIDMEQLNRLSPNLWQRVFRDEECDTLASLGDTPLVDAAFSAKEAVFKAVNPSVGEYIPFHDVSIEFEGDARFTAVYHGHDRRNRCMLTGRGVWRTFGHHVFTLFYIK